MKNNLPFFYTRSLFTCFGLSIILKQSKNLFFIPIIIGTILGIIVLINFKKKPLFKKIYSILLIITCLMSLTFLCHKYFLIHTSPFLIFIFSLLICFFIGTSSFEALKRTSNIFFVIVILMIIFELVVLVPKLNLNNFYLIEYPSTIDIFTSTISYTVLSILPIIVLGDHKNAITRYIIASISLFIIAFLIFFTLGPLEIGIYSFPEYMILKDIKIFDFISNVDNIFSFVFICDLVLTISGGLNQLFYVKNIL